MIKLLDLVKIYGQTQVLNKLNLNVNQGELFAFLGPNGAGKTTTIRILNGLTSLSSGQALINGIDLAQNPQKAKSLCGLATQHINLDGDLTVAENLDIHGRLYSMPKKKRHQRRQELLEYVEMEDRGESLVKTLSGGLKRRLMIARALLHQPQVLFLDEPTVGLDPAIRRRIWNLIKRVRSDGVTIFLTTHYIEEAEILADRVAFIHHGKLIRSGSPSEIMASLGNWAVDHFGSEGAETKFFQERHQATAHLNSTELEMTLRRINLEDAFLTLTGTRVRP